MNAFRQILANTLIANITNNFLWFAVTFWVFLETRSVFATSLVSGIYLVTASLSGFWFGSIVDHNRKTKAMMLSSAASLSLFVLAYVYALRTPDSTFKNPNSVELWVFVVVMMLGIIAGNIRNIAVPTLVTILVPAEERDKANGMVGAVIGIAFSITSFASGFALANLGIRGVIVATVLCTILAMAHLALIHVPENEIVHAEHETKGVDLRGTTNVVRAIPGLIGLIFFNAFNNFLGGVFMALMDAYGLSLVSVQAWGVLWGVLSLGLIIGGALVAKRGLGPRPLHTLFRINIVLWILSIVFPIQPWIALMAVCFMGYMILIPFVEASEQTILQKVVPVERQGRVFGFAQSIEQSASPLTAFLIGPIAQFIFIPFMTTGAGARWIGSWFGTGPGRGLALVFILTGVVGLVMTLMAMRSTSFKLLAAAYAEPSPAAD